MEAKLTFNHIYLARILINNNFYIVWRYHINEMEVLWDDPQYYHLCKPYRKSPNFQDIQQWQIKAPINFVLEPELMKISN